jgi:phytoene desaturase
MVRVMKNNNAIVIGSGIGGLAAAIRLARAGKSVKVFEANAFYGGKISSKQFGGYRFDMGPSIFTCPHYIKELFDLCGADFQSRFPYQRATHLMNYFYPDGTRFELSGDKEKTIQTLSQVFGTPAETIEAYLEKAQKNYDLIAPLFIERSLHRFRHLIGPELFKALAHLGSYRLLDTMHSENSRFFKDPRLVQFFDRFATYNGSDPYQTPAMLNMIANLEFQDGVFIPEDGMIQITRSLYELGLELGVQFHFEEKVSGIRIQQGKVIGVTTEKAVYDASVVFSNMDVAYTYEQLMPGVRKPEKILNHERSSSAIVYYWGIRRSFPELDLHNIFFSEDYQEEFHALFKEHRLVDDPTIYINITSKYVKGDAPEGCENWFVMVNAPVIKGQDWEEVKKRHRANLIRKINRHLHTDIEPLIETEFVMDPLYIQNTYSGKQGSIYGNASNSKFSAFYRHPNFSPDVKGLYFVGVTVHPGGGIPLALNSARIAVRCMEEDGM